MTLDTSLELREMFDVALADQAEFSKCPYPDNEVPGFKPAMRELIGETKNLIQILLKLIARALYLQDEDYFIPLHKNVEDSSIPNFTQLRTLFYPKVPEGFELKPGVVRCAEHTDYGTLTLLFQDSMGGLQVTSVNGKIG
jgi:isopenicillin N synthase-like dioxygenase